MFLQAQAYLDGVNAFIDNGPTPIEFYLTGVQKEHYELLDVYNIISYMSFSFNKGYRDVNNSNLVQLLDTTYTNPLFKRFDTYRVPLYPDGVVQSSAQITAKIDEIISDLPVPVFHGSNAFVLSGAKTIHGKVILENDPHIAHAQPAVWYESHVVTPEDERYGFYLVGVPFSIHNHNRVSGYGLTMLSNDETNFFYEKVHPTDTSLYLVDSTWHKFQYHEKVIKVKDADPVTFKYKSTEHGPIMNANYGGQTEIASEVPVSMDWLYTKVDNKLLHVLYGTSTNKDLKEFSEAASMIHAPGLNLIYGDSLGNIAWFACAKLWKKKPETDTRFILDGSVRHPDLETYYDFVDNPRSINPPDGYIYSANTEPETDSLQPIEGYYAYAENRGGRLLEIIKEKEDNWESADLQTVPLDLKLRVYDKLLPYLLEVLDKKSLGPYSLRAINILKKWDGTYTRESVAALIFDEWLRLIHQKAFKDELGSEERYLQFYEQLDLFKIIYNVDSPWWDDVTTEEVESCAQIVALALEDVITSLSKMQGVELSEWQWGNRHYLEHKHALGSVKWLKPIFNVGPFPSEGTDGTLNNQPYKMDADKRLSVKSIPSTRRIIDFGDIENSKAIIPTGQSGNIFSQFYDDQAEMYNNGEYRKMLLNKEEIKTSTDLELILSP